MNMSKFIKPILGVVGVLLVVLIVASVVLASLNSARSGYTSNLSIGVDMSDGIMTEEAVYDYAESSRSYTSQKAAVADYDEDSGGDAYTDERQIIKTGSLSLVVEDVESAVQELGGIAKNYNGLVAYQDISDSQQNKKRGSITLRVPNESFELVISEAKEQATKVTRELVNTQDVTEEYADLQAQLRNKQAVEEQYLETLKKAWSIEDILNVQQRLDTTRDAIERLQGRITYMERQVSMSTITISLVSESEAAVLGVVWNPLTKAKQAAYSALESLISFVYFVINLVFVIPVILVWIATIGGLGYVAWKILLMLKRKLFGRPE